MQTKTEIKSIINAKMNEIKNTDPRIQLYEAWQAPGVNSIDFGLKQDELVEYVVNDSTRSFSFGFALAESQLLNLYRACKKSLSFLDSQKEEIIPVGVEKYVTFLISESDECSQWRRTYFSEIGAMRSQVGHALRVYFKIAS